MNIFLAALIISMASYLAIGWYAGRKVKNLDDYYVAGRNAPTLLIVGTLVASFMSTNAFLGEMGMSYQGHGPLIVIMTGVNCLGYIFGALFFGRYLRRSRVLTVPRIFWSTISEPTAAIPRRFDHRHRSDLLFNGSNLGCVSYRL